MPAMENDTCKANTVSSGREKSPPSASAAGRAGLCILKGTPAQPWLDTPAGAMCSKRREEVAGGCWPGTRLLWPSLLGPLKEGVFWGLSLWDTFLEHPCTPSLTPSCGITSLRAVLMPRERGRGVCICAGQGKMDLVIFN